MLIKSQFVVTILKLIITCEHINTGRGKTIKGQIYNRIINIMKSPRRHPHKQSLETNLDAM